MAAPLLWAYRGLTRIAPWLLTRAARRAHIAQGADPSRLRERFGQASLPRPEGPLVWLHAASVGEVQSVAALAPLLTEHANLLVTTSTQSGAERAAEVLPPEVLHQFQPVDTAAAVKAFLAHWQPSLVAFVEADIWPRMSAQLRASGVPIALLNARASRTRTRAPRLARTLLERCALISCQSEAVLQELISLGLAEEKLCYFGDLKAELPLLPPAAEVLASFQAAANRRPVWAAVSTHPSDEAAVVKAHETVLQTAPDALLFWLPRHPKRADIIEQSTALPLARRSRGQAPKADQTIYLVDTLGEASAAFSVAPVVFLGGSFGPEGGHTPFEPAQHGCMVLHGPNVENFSAAYAKLGAAGIAHEVSPQMLANAVLARLGQSHGKVLPPQEPKAARATAERLSALLLREPDI